MKTENERRIRAGVLAGLLCTLPAATQAPAPGPELEAESGRDTGVFLRVVPDTTEAVVGERVPVKIEAWFPEGMNGSLDSLPSLDSSAFTLEKIEPEAVRSRERIGGRSYRVLTWHSAVAPIKSGEFELGARLEATLVVPRERKDPTRAGSPFGDAFDRGPFGGRSPFGRDPFDDEFFSRFFDRGRREKVTVATRSPETMTVRALPSEGRPSGFRGAVGRFEMEAHARDDAVVEGDPVTIDVTVTGRGNFDRVTAPVLTDDGEFRLYPGKSEFFANEGGASKRRFVMTVVPRRAGLSEIPPLELPYFDTERGDWVTLRTAPIPVRVDPAPAGSRPRAGTNTAGSAPAVTDGLRPVRSELVVRPAEPPWQRPWFIALSGLALAFAAVGIGLRKHRRRHERQPEIRRDRARARDVRRAFGAIDAAVRFGDARAFAEGCRRAIDAESSRCDGASTDELSPILEMADAVSFGGRPLTEDEMTRWRARLAVACGVKEAR